VDYFEALGGELDPLAGCARARIVAAMRGIESYEQELASAMLGALAGAGAEVYGVANPNQVHLRVPTFCFNLPGVRPAAVSQSLADAGVGIRDGHMYAPRLMERLGLAMDSGAVRASLVHYNNIAEIERFAEALRGLAA
jgi:selenocysteine lyase/cysteine desulfurase